MFTNSYLRFTTLSLALSQLVFSTSLPATAALQQTQQQPFAHPSRIELARFFGFKFPRIRASGNLYGGGVRGNCMAEQVDMKALVPNSQIGLTLVQNPTFFVRLSKTTAKQAKFTLINVNDNSATYEKTFPVTSTGGVISFTLPADAGALKANQEYHWGLQLLCENADGDQGANPIVDGAIKRVEPNATLASQLRSASLSDRVTLYAENGYWYDTIKTLADLRAANPKDPTLTDNWSQLLNQAGLQEIAQDPLIQCCTLR